MNERIKEQVTVIHINAHFSHTQRGGGRTGDRPTLKRLSPGCEHSELTKEYDYQRILTPSPPHPVIFPGWKMHGRACKEYIFRSYNTYLQYYTFWWRFFDMPVRKRRQKGLRVSNFALLLVDFKMTSWQWRGLCNGIVFVCVEVWPGILLTSWQWRG